ncbi:hypothetical protein D3C80_687230 [compost metagenome]
MRGVDAADLEGDADLRQVAFPGQQQALEAGLAVEEGKAQGLALVIDQLISGRFPAGRLQQRQGLQLLVANQP